ncbi:hypothetical protein [Desulfobacula sp.]|uniref:hypothetical protein n=1 Tax=Desulfobacula sp. TaxID=2593537 RepID=UPI002604035C|nr:hypothetical protein [Desulfobacula sp.]
MKKLRLLLPCAVLLGFLFFPAVSFSLDVGDKAPSFSGKSTQGMVSLGEFTGKKNVVLALYYAVFTPV